ncbi:MAG: TolC family protein, partial [bacterium]
IILNLFLFNFSLANLANFENLDDIIYNLPEVKKALYEAKYSYYDLKALYSQLGINAESYYQYTYNQPTVTIPIGFQSIRISNDYNYNYGLQINWLLKTFGFIENQILAKEMIYKAKKINYEQTVSESYLKFYKALYEVYKSYINYSFTVQLRDFTDELLSSTKKLYDSGIIAKVDYLRVLSTYNDYQAQLDSSYRYYKISLRNLYSFLYPEKTIDDNFIQSNCLDKIRLDEILLTYGKYLEDYSGETIEIDKDLERNSSNARVLQILYCNLVSLEYQKKSVLSQNNPRLALFSQYNRQRASGFSRDYNFNVGLSLTWKIFDSGLSNRQALSVEQQKEVLNQQYIRTLSDLQNQKENIKNKFYVDLNLYRSLLSNLEYKKEAFRLMKLKYQNGMATYLDYLDSQNNLLKTLFDIKSYKNEIFLDYVNFMYLNDHDMSFRNVFGKIIGKRGR